MVPRSQPNRLFYGDNLDVLRRGKIAHESVDLIYLDPPFNSRREYNQFMREADGSLAASQHQAFLDNWDWTQAVDTYEELTKQGDDIAEVLRALHTTMGPSDTLAYLVMMGARLRALHAALKPTGSLYLHCDPTASHYLKVLMDSVFGVANFRSEIIWKRTSAHSSAKRYGPVHDVILYYTKSDAFTWNKQFGPYDQTYLDEFYTHVDSDGRRWRRSDLTGAGTRNGETGQRWRGIDVTAKGRHWFVPPTELDKLDANGKIHWPAKKGGMPMLKRYADEQKGVPLQDVWTDIKPLHNLAAERVHFPTQKPVQLLDRIIRASTRPDDIVFDPFCGCGTTIAAAQALNRRWIGIDVTARAIDVIIDRLRRDHKGIERTYRVEQYPYSIPDAKRLANENKFHFQRWALERLGVDPSDIKPGADRGIDGKLHFSDGDSGRTNRIVLSVKAGRHVGPDAARDLRGVLDRDGFQIGVLVTLGELTDATAKELASGRRYYETSDGRRFLRMQHLTVDDIFAGKSVEYPGAERLKFRPVIAISQERHAETLELDFDAEPAAALQTRKLRLAKAELKRQRRKTG